MGGREGAGKGQILLLMPPLHLSDGRDTEGPGKVKKGVVPGRRSPARLASHSPAPPPEAWRGKGARARVLSVPLV